jgi:acyl-coenzyme A synthetase/AMP-(fatty) acid ligase
MNFTVATYRYLAASVASLFILATTPSFADDPAANFVTRLFTEVCIPNMGHPDKVRAWADQKKLPRIDSPEALRVFVGAGANGSAWYLPSSLGNFSLSIRGTTEACAVWAREANPADVDTMFRKIMEGVKRPGLQVAIFDQQNRLTPVGEARSLVYSVRPTTGPNGFLFTLLTSQNPGSAFQVSMQVARSVFQ